VAVVLNKQKAAHKVQQKRQLGVLMPKGSEDLLDYVNEFLDDEKKSGRINELSDKYIYRYIEEKMDDAA
jgi:ABC-type amino acid transport substrate-binding protein